MLGSKGKFEKLNEDSGSLTVTRAGMKLLKPVKTVAMSKSQLHSCCGLRVIFVGSKDFSHTILMNYFWNRYKYNSLEFARYVTEQTQCGSYSKHRPQIFTSQVFLLSDMIKKFTSFAYFCHEKAYSVCFPSLIKLYNIRMIKRS